MAAGTDALEPTIMRRQEGYERVADLTAKLLDTRLVYVAYREAEIPELMVRARDLDTAADWLLRAKHNRSLPGAKKLRASLLESALLREMRQEGAARVMVRPPPPRWSGQGAVPARSSNRSPKDMVWPRRRAQEHAPDALLPASADAISIRDAQ
jgi:hypothetical protein